jgi:transcriptional regulator with XRE-family HTH domain
MTPHPVVMVFDHAAFVRARESSGMSQALLAGLAGCGVSTVQRLEVGAVDPQGSTIAALASVLNVSMDALYRPEGQEAA